jgi:hypothetical protein
MGFLEQQMVAAQQRGESAGHDYFEDGLGMVEGQMGEQSALEQRRAQLEHGLGSDVQLDHDGVIDWQADEAERGRVGLVRKDGAGQLSRTQRKAKRETQSLYEQAYKLDAAGDHAKADEIRAQADQAFESAGLGSHFEVADRYDPRMQKGSKQLQSASGRLAGETVRDANELMDPDSETTKSFRDSLTKGALAEVDAAETNAGRALATQERSAIRSNRDAALATGGARSFGSEAALNARSSERFAGQRAEVATNAGAARAQIHSKAAQFYETFKREWAVDAAQAGRDYINNVSFVRDSYRQMQISLTGIFAELSATAGAASMGLAGTAMQTSADIYATDKAADAAEKAAKQEMYGSIVGGVLGILGGAFKMGGGSGSTSLTVGAEQMPARDFGGPMGGNYHGYDFGSIA